MIWPIPESGSWGEFKHLGCPVCGRLVTTNLHPDDQWCRHENLFGLHMGDLARKYPDSKWTKMVPVVVARKAVKV